MEDHRDVVFYGPTRSRSLLVPDSLAVERDAKCFLVDAIEEIQNLLREMRCELEEIRAIKLALLASPSRTPSPTTSLLADVTLFEKMEQQRNEILNRTREREARWLIEEERTRKERLEYEEQERIFAVASERTN
jgi:hypothetical protein